VQAKGAKPAATKKETKKEVDKAEEKMNITGFPKSIDHHMEEITSFLKRLESELVVHEYPSH
jgi:hypothetical protein